MDGTQLILLVLAFVGGMVTMIVLSAVMVSREALSPEEERLRELKA